MRITVGALLGGGETEEEEEDAIAGAESTVRNAAITVGGKTMSGHPVVAATALSSASDMRSSSLSTAACHEPQSSGVRTT